MNKKSLIGIVISIIVIALAVGAYLLLTNKEDVPKTLDLATISNNITNTGFAEMAMGDVDKDILASYFQVDTTNVEEVVGKMPMMNVHASMYILIKAADGKVETVKQEIETFGQNYEEQWERYLPEQYDLVLNRKIGIVGEYVYLIIAETAEELVKFIK